VEQFYNIQAEIDILGGILTDNDNLIEVIDILKPEDFFKGTHKNLYQGMIALYSQEKPVDITNLVNFFRNDIGAFGGISGLSEIMAKAAPHFSRSHAEIIKEKSNMRKLQLILQHTLQDLAKNSYDEALNKIQGDALNLSSDNESEYVTDTELMKRTIETIEFNYQNKGQTLGIESGLPSLDKAISGFEKGMVYVVAGRPSMGKTAFTLNLIQKFSEKHRGLFYSQEMNEQQLGMRRLAMKAMIDAAKLKSGNLQDNDFITLVQRGSQISQGGCVTSCKSSVHVNEILAHGKKMKLQGGIDFIAVDHLDLMDNSEMGENLRIQTTTKMKRLKTIAKELECPVIVLSQLSRAVEMRADKRPMLSDLKESAGVEENSDIVLMLYRDEYYNKDTEKKNLVEVIIGKQRDGRTGTLEFAWMPQYQMFAELDRYR
jgi:replicative DNA helicase